MELLKMLLHQNNAFWDPRVFLLVIITDILLLKSSQDGQKH